MALKVTCRAGLWSNSTIAQALGSCPQVALDCKERGTLLAAVWAHCMALVELRCGLASRQALERQEGVSAALRQEAFAAAALVKCTANPLNSAAIRVDDAILLDHDRTMCASADAKT